VATRAAQSEAPGGNALRDVPERPPRSAINSVPPILRPQVPGVPRVSQLHQLCSPPRPRPQSRSDLSKNRRSRSASSRHCPYVSSRFRSWPYDPNHRHDVFCAHECRRISFSVGLAPVNSGFPCNAVVASLHSGGPASLVWIAARTFCALPRALSTLRVAFSNSLKDVSCARFCRIAGVCISSPSGGTLPKVRDLGPVNRLRCVVHVASPPCQSPNGFWSWRPLGRDFSVCRTCTIYDACAAYRFSIGHTTGLFRGVICQHPGGHRADLIPVATTISFGPIGRAASAIARTIILEVRSRRGARLAQCALLFSGSCRVGARPRLSHEDNPAKLHWFIVRWQ
jgi:hypothetical protein